MMHTGPLTEMAHNRTIAQAWDDAINERDRARRVAVQLEQENAELGERLAGALAAARDLPCTCNRFVDPDLCRACCLVAQLEIPGSNNYALIPF